MSREQALIPRAVMAIAAAAAALAIGAAALASCSLDYDNALLDEQAAGSLPDTVATDLVHRVVKNSRTTLEVTADRAESWDAERRTVLDGASFVEYDRDGNPAVEGTAGRVVFHADTEDAEISGHVRVHSAVEEAGVEADALTWRSDPRLLAAPAESTVVITRDDGSRLEGSGFTGDFRRREFVFSGPVSGTYVWTGEEKE
jgi:LPS export ABC transporter protein LptC